MCNKQVKNAESITKDGKERSFRMEKKHVEKSIDCCRNKHHLILNYLLYLSVTHHFPISRKIFVLFNLWVIVATNFRNVRS